MRSLILSWSSRVEEEARLSTESMNKEFDFEFESLGSKNDLRI